MRLVNDIHELQLIRDSGADPETIHGGWLLALTNDKIAMMERGLGCHHSATFVCEY